MSNNIWLTSPEIVEALGITPQAFAQNLKRLMRKHGSMSPRGDMLRSEWGNWRLYLETRQNLIAAGVWASNRPYSLQDFDEIVLADMYEEYQPD